MVKNHCELIAASLVLLLLMAGCPQQPPADVDVNQTLPQEEGPAGPGITERPDYLNETVFEQLPPFPRDLYKLRNQIKYGEFWDMAAIEPEYYKQPEFYPNFESVGIPLIQTPSGTSYAGFGAYPADVQVITFPGDTIELATFFTAAWGVQAWQGIGLTSSVADANGEEVDYISVDVEPDAILLGPNYPVFTYEWAQKVSVVLNVEDDAPQGVYTVGVTNAPVPSDKSEEWEDEYGGLYSEGGMFQTGLDRPYFKVVVTVT